MKRGILHALVLVGVLFALCGQVLAAQSVTAVGRAEIVGSNKDGARNNALANAFREAVEKGIGVWVQSQTEVKDAAVVRDQILTRAQGYVTDHEIVKEKVEDNILVLTIKANVAVDKIGADIKALVGRVSTAMGNPSITFVLTTWEKRGQQGSASRTDAVDVSVKADTKTKYDVADDSSANASQSSSTRAKGYNDASVAVDASTKVKQDSSYSKINEDLWKKYPDMTIIDSFQQEFLAKNFDLMAADKARQIAVAESLAQTSVNPNDRQAVRDSAAKEGASFVARGEVRVLGFGVSEATGNQEVKTQIGVEIIDVNSGDIVGSFTNTATATSSNIEEAKVQSIKKNAVMAARTLAGQTIDVWQKRALSGKQYSIEVRNVKSVRSQQLPIIAAIKGIAQITNQTNSDKTTLLVRVMYKGDKDSLGTGIIEAVGSKPGFSEAEFDGPANEDGKIVFTFKK